MFGRLKGMLAPGGRIAVEDIDMSGAYCFPADAAQDRYQALYTEAVRRGGGDANLGRRLPASRSRPACRRAGGCSSLSTPPAAISG